MQLAQLEFNLGQAAQEIDLPGAENATAADGGLGAFLGQMLTAVFGVSTLLVLLYLIWGAIQWISSGGDKGKVEQARNRITQAVIGLIVLGASLVIMMILQSFLGIQFFKFSGGTTSKITQPSSGIEAGVGRGGGIGNKTEDGSGSNTLPGTSTKTGPSGTKF